MDALKSLKEPPEKTSWKTAEGEGYYSAFVLRVEDSLDELSASLKKKRATLPFTTQNPDDVASSNTEDEVAMQKANKKREEAELKKKEQAAKRKKADDIFKAAKRSRVETFKNLDIESDTDYGDIEDSDEDPEVIPKTQFDELKIAYDTLEKEKEKVDKNFLDLKKQYDEMKVEISEVIHLRSLNRQLQEKLLAVPITQEGCFHTTYGQNEVESDCETTEVELAPGISINKKIYNEICNLDHVRKFTKSLAVAIWGTDILAGRSVKGKPCKNRNGPKKVIPSDEAEVTPPNKESKPPLTPEKLAVISGQMREYLLKKGKDVAEVEQELKNRNRYISDKIMDIRSNIARAGAIKQLI